MPRNDSDKNEPDDFVSYGSLKNYTVATGSLTLVINTSLYFYKIIKGGDMPNSFLISIALLLSILYILSFFKRGKGITMPKYLWITFLNSLMLFTSISGVNGMLDSARQQFDNQNSRSLSSLIDRNHFPVSEASIGSFFKHLIFPTHGWFNIAEAEYNKTKDIVATAIANIETTQKLSDTLIRQKTNDMNTIDTLYKTIDTLRFNYIKSLKLLQKADSSARTIQHLPTVRNILHGIVVEVTRAAPEIETDQQLLQLQRLQQQQVQEQQIQQLEQQLQKLGQQRRKLKEAVIYNY